ncbi:MAG TPA: serine/threonine-protein kinase [Pseudomonadota bacterium]|nr:serine/threonine-protein kinase [Pseudomonadota bacterium]
MPIPQSPADGGAAGSTKNASDNLSKRIGATVGGRYKIISLLGAGELGGVYLVEHNQLRKNMAIKVISSEVLPTPELAARFESAALATAPLDHPSIVAPSDIGRTEDGAVFLVYEYVTGKTLREALAAGPLPLPRVLQLARQLVSALVAAHAAGVLHHDLTPEKIVLQQREGEPDLVRVRDFGLAKVRAEALGATQWDPSRSQAPTRHATAFGAPQYLAPEQSVGGEVDARADLYSLGVILYELLTGAPPFRGEDPAELLKQHVVGKVPPLSERAPQLKVPAALEELVMQLLAKSPEERPATARAVFATLDPLAVAAGLGAAPALPSDPKQVKDESLASALADLASPGGAAAADGEREVKPKWSGPGESDSPLAAALGVGQSAPPPKLRVPSAVDLELLQPDTANPAVLAPAPPPSASERVLDGSKEVARLGREVLLPAVKERGERAWTVARTHGTRGWSRLLGFIRPRLPPKLREVSDATIGLAVGGLAALLVLVLVLIAWPSSAPPKRPVVARAAMPGFASEREMEHGVEQGPAALAALVAKYPSDARCHRALVRAYAAKKKYVEALRALVPLLQLDPSAQSDEAMSQIVADAVFVPELSDSALAFLETAMGPHGVDVLLELADKPPTEPWRTKLAQSLAKPTVRQLASPEALLLLDLRAAARCEQKKALLPRAGQQGGARVQQYLQGLLQSTTGCGTGGKADCWPCLRKGGALQSAITAIGQRGATPP